MRFALVTLLLFIAGCRNAEQPPQAAKARQAIEAGAALPFNAMQVAGLTWYAIDTPPMTQASAMAARCAAGAFLGQTGWRQPTQPEVQQMLSATSAPPGRPPQFHTVVSSTPSGAGYFAVSGPGPMAAPFVAIPDQLFPTTVCVSQPQNMAYDSNLTWYRNTQTQTSVGSLAAWCGSLTVMGRGGWRLPTESEARAFYANQATIPNAAYWRTVSTLPVAHLVTSTPAPGGQLSIDLANGLTMGLPPGVLTNATCVTGDGLPPLGASTGGLLWLRDPAFEWNLDTYCATTTMLGVGGWRMPTQPEVEAFYANRDTIPQFSNWATMPDMVLTSTPFGAGYFALGLMSGGTFPIPMLNGPKTCVTAQQLGGTPAGWGPTDPCLTNNGGCSTNALCINNAGTAVCQCRSGYSGDGLVCNDINECQTNNGGCSVNATCTNSPGSFSCTCVPGYRGPGSDGVVCNQDSECAVNFGGCFPTGICVSPAGCYCPLGTVGDGRSCSPVPACAAVPYQVLAMATFEDPRVVGPEVHQPNANYVNAGVRVRKWLTGTGYLPAPEATQFGYVKGGGSFTMTAAVPAGSYQLQLKVAQGREPGVPLPVQPLSIFVDGVLINTATPPSGTSFVTLSVGNFALAQGQRSLRFSVPAGAETVLFDAVALRLITPTTPAPTGCAGGSTCNPSTYSCTDVNECLTNNGGCSANATCTNTVGGRTCSCNAGYTGDGVTCADINECMGGTLPTQYSLGFEAPVTASWLYEPTNVDGWAFVGGGLRSGAWAYGMKNGPPAPEGGQYAYFGTSMQKTIVLTGSVHTLSFRAARDRGSYEFEPSPSTLSLPFRVYIDGVLQGTYAPPSTTSFTLYSLTFSAPPGSHVVRFENASSLHALIDSVVVVQGAVAPSGNGGCGPQASCTNTVGGRTCTCLAGFTGDGFTCSDTNECSTNNGGCSPNATCTNTVGGRTCACNSGFSGWGLTCVDINECMGGSMATQYSTGFEAPATTSSVYQPTNADGWVFTAGGLRSGAWAYGLLNGPPAQEGGQYAYFATSMQKTLSLSGTTHTLTFRAARDRGSFEWQPSPSDLSLPFRVFVDGVLQGTYAPGSTTSFTPYSLTFSASPGSHVLRFENASHLNALVDSVVVVEGIVGPSGNGGCSAQASCSNTIGGRTCTCMQGFTGDGFTCSDVNECTTNNGGCSPNAICTNTVGSRTCACSPGYSGAGLTCVDVNECLTNNGGCAPQPSGVCTNTVGGRTCACSNGYSGNGFTCTDVNECLTNNGGCAPAPAGVCSNIAGGRVCGCASGYSGDGFSCSDINECLTNNGGCVPPPIGICTNTPGSRTCACAPGNVGNGVTCVPDCSVNNGGCSGDAVCAVNAGVRSCTCANGFAGNGISCADVNECATGNGGCSGNATCSNLIGAAPACACNSGFEGDGVTCTAVSATEPALSAGKTATSFSVSNTGGFDYRIPLWTPPGVGGAQLRLALAYSGDGNGSFGTGWELSGLQSLTRCAGKYVSRGSAKPITMTAQDPMCLNGQELMLTSGTYGAVGSRYGAELESFSLVEAGSSLQGSAPQTFTVTTRNGPIYTFGAGASVPDAPATPWRWLLSKLADRAGNSIGFNYLSNPENVPLLSTITGPTTATGSGPFWKVQFNYEARPATDMTASYFVGSLVKQTRRVKSIEMTSLPSNRLLRRYELTYEQGGSRRSRLTSIQECTATSCLAPVVVSYSNGQTDRPFTVAAQYASAPVHVGAGGVLPVDLNADGKTDIVWCALVPGGLCNWLARLSTGTEFGPDLQLSSGAVPASLRVLPGAYSAGRAQVLVPTSTPPHTYELVAMDSSGSLARGGTGLVPNTADTVGDFDGDGLADLFQVDSTKGGSIRLRRNITPAGGAIAFAAAVTLYSAPGDTYFSEGLYGVVRPKYHPEWEMGIGSASPAAVKVGDFNGDGRADLAVSLFRLPGALSICAHSQNPTGIPLCELSFRFLLSNGLARGEVQPMSEIGALNNVDTIGQQGNPGFGTSPYLPPRLSFVNWNDDRCTDTILNGGDFGGLRLSNCKDGFSAPINYTSTIGTWTLGPERKKTLALDINGDGRDDFLQTGANLCFSSIFQSLSLSTGEGFTPESPNWSGDCLFQLPANPTSYIGHAHDGVVLDANGDGRSDVLFYQVAPDTAATQMSMQLYLRSGLASEPGPTGSGRRVVIQPPVDAATSFTDSVGVKTNVFYDTATVVHPPASWTGTLVPTGVYTAFSTTPVFPVVDYQPTSMLVRAWQVEAPSESPSAGGLGTLRYQQAFFYGGAKLHLQGRGFLGFASRVTLDSRTGTLTSEVFSQDFPTTGMTKSVNVTVDDYGSPRLTQNLSKSTLTLSSKSLTAGRFFPYVSQMVTEKYEVRNLVATLGSKPDTRVLTETITRVVDDYGNPTSVTTSTTDTDATAPASPFNGQTWTTVESRSFDNNATLTAWCLGLPSSLAITASVPGQPAQTRTTTYTNDTSIRCRNTVENVEPTAAPRFQTSTSFQFDGCGNVREAKVVGHAANGSLLTPRITTVDWGTRCQFPEKQWDALNQLRQVSYDYDLGKPLTQTDPNNAVTTQSYDSFGRTIRVVNPDSTFSTIRYSKVNALRPFATLVQLYGSDGALQSLQTTVNDVFDNIVSTTSTQAPAGRTIVQNRKYDWLNRPVQTDVPYALGGTRTGYSWTTYDAVGRVYSHNVSRLFADGSYSIEKGKSYAYLGRTIIERESPRGGDAAYDVTRVTDVGGKLRQVIEQQGGGTYRYDYDAFGSLVRVQSPDSVSSWSYDVNGFKVQESDADRGSSTFSVNSLGEVTGSTDAKAQTRSFTYDLLGRMTNRSEPEGTSVWTYGTAAPELGRLISVTGLGYSESSAYDAIGRLRRTTIVADGTHVFDYTYNALGEVDTVTYPETTSGSRLSLKKHYAFGEVVALSDNSTGASLWRLGSNHETGLPIDSYLGASRLRVNRSYKPATLELETLVSTLPGGALGGVQNLHYAWDSISSSLKHRQDYNKSLLESFTYDALERLRTVKLNAVPTLEMTYAPSGNIATRNGVSLSYADPSHPHAVTATGSNTFAYDSNGNMRTRNGLTQAWSSFDMPTSLVSPQGRSDFSYSPARTLYRQVARNSAGVVLETTTTVAGLFEKTVAGSTTTFRNLIPTPDGLLLIKTPTTMSLLLKDSLGSTDVIVNDATASVSHRASFDVFGARRNVATWNGAPLSVDVSALNAVTREGFTGHENLDALALVHMGGRVYDPGLGRFLSVDPLSDTTAPQTLNPYSYVRNRPATLTDPSGYWDDSPGSPGLDYANSVLGNLSFSQLAFGTPDFSFTPTTWSGLGSDPSGASQTQVIVITGTRLRDANVGGDGVAGWRSTLDSANNAIAGLGLGLGGSSREFGNPNFSVSSLAGLMDSIRAQRAKELGYRDTGMSCVQVYQTDAEFRPSTGEGVSPIDQYLAKVEAQERMWGMLPSGRNRQRTYAHAGGTKRPGALPMTQHGQERRQQGQYDANRYVPDQQKVIDRGDHYIDIRSDAHVYVLGPKVVIVGRDGVVTELGGYTKAQVFSKVERGIWEPANMWKGFEP